MYSGRRLDSPLPQKQRKSNSIIVHLFSPTALPLFDLLRCIFIVRTVVYSTRTSGTGSTYGVRTVLQFILPLDARYTVDSRLHCQVDCKVANL